MTKPTEPDEKIEDSLEEEVSTEKTETKPLPDRSAWRPVGIRIFFAVLALLAFSGLADRIVDGALAPVWETNEAFLNQSLNRSTKYLALLSLPKAVLDAIETGVIEPKAASIGVGRITLGALASPFKDIVDDLWEFMSFSTVLIIFQMALIKAIKLSSLKIIFGLGCLACTWNFSRESLTGKIGASFIILALTAYLIFPLSLNMAAGVYETYQVETDARLTQNLETLGAVFEDVREKLGQVNMANLWTDVKDILSDLSKTAWQTLRLVWDWGLRYLVGVMMMFVIVPLMVLGLVFFIVRQSLAYLDLPAARNALDRRTARSLSLIGRRTRRRSIKP